MKEKKVKYPIGDQDFKSIREGGEALRQIEEKQYALQFKQDRRKVFKIGVSFSSETRRIEDWKIE